MLYSSNFCVKPLVLQLPNTPIPVSTATRKGLTGVHTFTEQHFG